MKRPHIPQADETAIAHAVRVWSEGGLVAFPTETVYGLGADADNAAAVQSIFVAKGRPADHPVIVHVADAAAVSAWAREVPQSARRLMAAFWPGPLTLVLKRSTRAHDGLTGAQDTIGLRSPAHPWARELLAAWTIARNDPAAAIAAPSANSFGRISPTTAQHVRDDLGEKNASEKTEGRIELILDGGPCLVGIESTIVDLSGAAPRLLRPGTISRAQLEAVLKEPLADAGADAPRASGGLEKHYAPRTPLEIVGVAQLEQRIAALRGQKIAVLSPAQALLDDLSDNVVLRVIPPVDPDSYARQLYALLHQLDAAGADRIVIARPPLTASWEAVQDRLKRAAA